MEGQNLLSLVKGRNYNAELRAELGEFGLRRIGSNQWVSKNTANKYELVISSDTDEKIVKGVDVVEQGQRIHVMDVDAKPVTADGVVNTNIPVHHKTLGAIRHQIDITYDYLQLIDQWNAEIEAGSPLGVQLKQMTGGRYIMWNDFLVVPDPLASGDYLFATIQKGKAASIHAWLELPDGQYLVPTDGKEEGAMRSLEDGLRFHQWEESEFATAAAAGQFAIKMLNRSKTTYATAIRKLLGKEEALISRNDFYRNRDGEMCSIMVNHTDAGIVVADVPVKPNVASCIDCLLAPFVKARSIEAVGR